MGMRQEISHKLKLNMEKRVCHFHGKSMKAHSPNLIFLSGLWGSAANFTEPLEQREGVCGRGKILLSLRQENK